MSEETIVFHCSPTLAGMKTGSLFGTHYETRGEMVENMRKWNRILSKKGLRMIPLKYENQRALVYVFRVSQLKRDLKNEAAAALLKTRGYEGETPGRCIGQLMGHLRDDPDFPHEIGLFLGYPAEDVAGFIENGANACKYTGSWKVYGDVERAKVLFNRYHKCRDIYCSELARGNTMEKLIVSC